MKMIPNRRWHLHQAQLSRSWLSGLEPTHCPGKEQGLGTIASTEAGRHRIYCWRTSRDCTTRSVAHQVGWLFPREGPFMPTETQIGGSSSAMKTSTFPVSSHHHQQTLLLLSQIISNLQTVRRNLLSCASIRRPSTRPLQSIHNVWN